MEAGQLNTIAIQVAYIMVLFVAFIMFLFWWRIRMGKKLGSGDYIVAEMIPEAGKAHTELLHVVNGRVKIKPKNGKRGATYRVKDLNTYPIDYPSLPRWLAILQVAAEKTIIDEASCEPITNRIGIGGLTPEELYSWEEAIATQSAIALSKADHEIRDKVEVKKKPISWQLILILGIVAAVAIFAFYYFKQQDLVKDQLGVGLVLWENMKMMI
jgi:hypothetical protein